jgi:formimidoylglutamate deiminase
VATAVHAKEALLPDGWASDVRVVLDGGRIASVTPNVAPSAEDERLGCLVPGLSNVHSHAFQRGMAGVAETRGPTEDTFWSWRNVMYRFALQMTPEDVEAVAAQLYLEMLESGFTHVGEFHYLHHDETGRPYDDIAEMAVRIVEASESTGIGLTLLPVFYAHAGFGGTPPGEEQRRFINSIDTFAKLVDRCRSLARALPGGVSGVAPHSLRAVTPEELAELVQLSDGGPVHIHIAEQAKEVDDCIAWSGKRPVTWLFDNQPVDSRWCLIHATHITASETLAIATSGAVAGLCPITEANLGDGIFPAAAFRAAGGRLGVGSDSNILIGVSDELRQLEYSQRLATCSRNVLTDHGRSTGGALFTEALSGGATALGVDVGIGTGMPANMLHLVPRHDLLIGGDALLDAWIFSAAVTVNDVWVHGRKVVKEGRHIARDTVSRRFVRTMRNLTSD